jgi:hypothetical protein
MQIFAQKTSIQKADDELAKLKQRAERLAEKRAAADSELSAATAARQLLLVEGDLNDAKSAAALAARVHLAETGLSAINDAINVLAAQIAEAERQVAIEREQEARKAAADAISRETDAVAKLLTPWLEQTQKLAAAFETLANVDWDAGAIAKYLAGCRAEISIAAPLTVGALQHIATAIRDGLAKIPNRSAPPPMPKEPAREPMKKIFPLKAIRWRDKETGLERTHPSMLLIDLPESLAKHAIAIGAAVPLGHELEKKARGIRKDSFSPDPAKCVALDDVPDAAPKASGANAQPSQKHSLFEPVDRGKPYMVKIPREVAQ